MVQDLLDGIENRLNYRRVVDSIEDNNVNVESFR